jgi:hypothetical protein
MEEKMIDNVVRNNCVKPEESTNSEAERHRSIPTQEDLFSAAEAFTEALDLDSPTLLHDAIHRLNALDRRRSPAAASASVDGSKADSHL